MSPLRSRIVGSGFVTGQHLVTNDQLARMMDTSDAWIRERSGIETRYYVEKGTSTSDLGAGAAKEALADADVGKEEIDYIVFATMTPDHYFPGCGGILQDKMGLGHIPTLDIRQQCTGFIYGLQVSDALLRSGEARTLLLVGAEVHTGFMPWTRWDYLFGQGGEAPSEAEREVATQFRDRTVLFGDAGGAVVMRAEEGERGLLGFQLHSDGASFQDLYVPGVGFAHRPFVDEEQVRLWRHIPEMNGRAVFKLAVSRMPQAVRDLCARHHVAVGDIGLLIAHQANLRINEAVQKALGLPDERVTTTSRSTGTPPPPPSPSPSTNAARAGASAPASWSASSGWAPASTGARR